MTAQTRTASPPDYAAFIAALRLYNIGLKESSCSLDRDEYWKTDAEKKLDYKLTSKSNGQDKKHFDAESTLSLTLCGERPNSPVLRLSATFDLHFHGESITKEFVQQFCGSEIRLIVWPYFREFVTNMTARMHIPPVILPLSDKDR